MFRDKINFLNSFSIFNLREFSALFLFAMFQDYSEMG